MAVLALRAASIQHSFFSPPLKNKLTLSPSISFRSPILFALLLIPNSPLDSTRLNSFHFNCDFPSFSSSFDFLFSPWLRKWTSTWFRVKSVASDAIKFSRLADLYRSSFAVNWHKRYQCWTLFFFFFYTNLYNDRFFTVFFSCARAFYIYIHIHTYYLCFCQMIRFLQAVMLRSSQILLLPGKKPMPRLFLYLHFYIWLGFYSLNFTCIFISISN